jgi:hypothetical protein
MSLFDAIKKKAAFKTALQHVAEARALEGEKADALYRKAYQGFEAALHKDLQVSQALYQWGFALLHQAKSKSGDEATALYQDAITKFSFCLLIDPDYLGAAIDGGVALMDLARLKQAQADDALYTSAKRSFEKANKIQKGSASYNLACVHSLCGEEQACGEALKESKQQGTLPNAAEIVADPDLQAMAAMPWFIDFIESLKVIETAPIVEIPAMPSEPETPAAVESTEAEKTENQSESMTCEANDTPNSD